MQRQVASQMLLILMTFLVHLEMTAFEALLK